MVNRSTTLETQDCAWAELDDESLLNIRMCDLGLKLAGPILARIDRLERELAARHLWFRPHFWLSDEWFCPDGVPGIAVPFYLAHPRLARLERNQIRSVEGGPCEWCMRILRHEAGHAIDNAFRLHRRRRWQQVFGSATAPYPTSYRPKPHSRNYVLHLESWYAQSHPAEDFAETFAVWLKPRSCWRTQYDGWPALKKLEYVDELMRELRHRKPPVRSRERTDPLSALRKTLGEHYQEKRARYGIDQNDTYDAGLRRLFGKEPGRLSMTAVSFLSRNRNEIRRAVCKATEHHPYIVEQVLDEMIQRCRTLKLWVNGSERAVRREACFIVTRQTDRFLLHSGRHRVVL